MKNPLNDYQSFELYGELMRRGDSWRYEWARHVVALSRAMRLLDHCAPVTGNYAAAELVREAVISWTRSR